MEDQESSDALALQVFSLASPFHDALQATVREIPMYGKTLLINQSWAPGGKGGTDIGFGASVYNCALVLALYLEANPFEVANKTCLELGCGPGLVSISAELAGASQVWMTDGDTKSVDLAAENRDKNCSDQTRVQPLKLLWDDTEDTAILSQQLKDESVNVILMSDVIALPYKEHFASLFRTLTTFCRHPTDAILFTYQRRHTCEDEFFVLLRTAFDVVRLPQESIHSDFQQLPIQLYKAIPLTPNPPSLSLLASPDSPAVVAIRAPLDLQSAFFPSSVACQCLSSGNKDSSSGSSEDANHRTVKTAEVASTVQERLNAKQLRRKLASMLLFPTLLTNKCILREIRNSDATAYLDIRRALAKNSHVMDIWGAMPMELGSGALQAALTRIEKIRSDRIDCKGIRWGITLQPTALVSERGTYHSCQELWTAETDCENSCKYKSIASNELLIGTIGFWRVDTYSFSAEIGYELHPSYWGQGIMTDALKAVIRFGFEVMKLHSIEANIDPRNDKSGAVLRRAGFKQEALFKEHYYHDGVFKDSAIFRILESDFLRSI